MNTTFDLSKCLKYNYSVYQSSSGFWYYSLFGDGLKFGGNLYGFGSKNEATSRAKKHLDKIMQRKKR